jgi:signal transduction histidine kinase
MPFAKFQLPSSLRVRLLAVYVFGMLFSAIVVAIAASLLTEPIKKYFLQSGAIDFSEEVARSIKFDAKGLPVGIDETKIDQWILTSLSEEIAVRVTDPSGTVYFSSSADKTPLVEDSSRFDYNIRGFSVSPGGISMHVGNVPLISHGRLWYVQFAASDRLIIRLRKSLGVPAIYQGVVLLLFTFLAVFLITTPPVLRRLLQPLHAASIAAQQITPQTLDVRLETCDLPTEIRPLVDAFNLVLDRLQNGFRNQQDFLANAAHELKTPLALIRAQIELSPQDGRHPFLIDDIDRMARQIQQLLHLAEASELRNYKVAYVEPRSIVNEACAFMDRVAENHGVKICFRCEEIRGGWQADRGALFTLFKNLLENAIQHSPVGGAVTLSASSQGFVVTDEGPGVKPGELQDLFRRFWRGADRRDTGAGLGLSICQEIAHAHGWHIHAKPGIVGLEVYVLMPTIPNSSQKVKAT